MKPGMVVRVKKEACVGPPGSPVSAFAGATGRIIEIDNSRLWPVRVAIEGFQNVRFKPDELVVVGWGNEADDADE